MRYRVVPVLLAVLVAGILLAQRNTTEGQETDTPATPAGTEVQARGPVHEAYAEPTTSSAEPGVIASKEPPQPIEESPPEEKPEGDNVIWIPGYWSWDTEASDFLWVSGFWRAVPPDRAWNPGYWQKVDDGWQWVSGYWSDAEATETEYLPEPPATLDNGPSTPAPDSTSDYIPGCWVYQTNRYMWRPGYWLEHRADWVWTPACYRWTPFGHIFVNGFWDRPLLERGLLFAPVRFDRRVYAERDFVYQPSYVIQPDFLISALFVRTNRPCYYFGDYFEARYRKTFVSWMDYRIHRTVLDPNFRYYRTAYAGHPEWERNLHTLYQGRYEGTVARPPVTLVQQTKLVSTITSEKTTNVAVAKNVNLTRIQNVSVLQPVKKANSIHVTALASLAGGKPGAAFRPPVQHEFRMQRVSKERLAEERHSATRLRAIAKERATTHAATVKRPPATGSAPVRVKHNLPKETPPARVIRHPVKPPPAPPHEKATPHAKAPPPREKDRTKTPTPPPKEKARPPVHEKEKERPRPTPPPKEKPRPPVHEKEKEKPKPPPAKEKPRPPVHEKEKEKPKPPPAKEKPKPPPPAKEKPKPPPKEKEKSGKE